MAGILQEVITLLTSGITQMASGIGAGLSELVQNIFITTNGDTESLSVFGGVVVVFAGISLAVGLCRWVTGFITSLGARN